MAASWKLSDFKRKRWFIFGATLKTGSSQRTMFALSEILISFRECAAATVEPHLKKSSRGSITSPSPNRLICRSVTTSQKVLAIRFNPKSQQRSLDAVQWGLIAYWAKDPKVAYRTINARAETVDKAPSFRQAFANRRCLIPANGFYEWRKMARPKLPYAIAMKDVRPFTFAGLWENWRDPESGGWLRTCTIITQASLMRL
jgi:putative SOS response-associated peptidase YedK